MCPDQQGSAAVQVASYLVTTPALEAHLETAGLEEASPGRSYLQSINQSINQPIQSSDRSVVASSNCMGDLLIDLID